MAIWNNKATIEQPLPRFLSIARRTVRRCVFGLFLFLSVIIDPGFIYREAVSRRDEFPRALNSVSYTCSKNIYHFVFVLCLVKVIFDVSSWICSRRMVWCCYELRSKKNCTVFFMKMKLKVMQMIFEVVLTYWYLPRIKFRDNNRRKIATVLFLSGNNVGNYVNDIWDVFDVCKLEKWISIRI